MARPLVEHTCDYSTCHDCGACQHQVGDLFIVAADYGDGAFLDVLCRVCQHRRQYRGELRQRLKDRRRVLPS